MNNKEDGKHSMARRLRFKKVLVVLDDINHEDHLDNLAGDLDCFSKDGRIISTKSEKHLIGKNDIVYEVTLLADHQAIQLFNLHVLSRRKLQTTVKVWGSFLDNRDITAWKNAIEKMKMNSKIRNH
ncbi:hypothetical protein H5410_027950 [Solanum commersonii]|uniref:NB-ARC domain-containing protein n=1 Tax=Solanum commersonii TaxID=4109 RepID=A0A9J5Z1A0_SOLCO|nr:hypothetical protein H5410_027950 [Solanum commersonii]